MSNDHYCMERQILDTQQSTENHKALWVVILGLKPVIDGDMYGFIWGDLPTGVAGYGETPYKAMWEFEKAMSKTVSVGNL